MKQLVVIQWAIYTNPPFEGREHDLQAGCGYVCDR
jgi:hypothetical protein